MSASRRFLPLFLFLLAPALFADDKPADPLAAITAQVRELEKRIEKVRGLAFKKQLVINVIARGKDEKGVQGYYDTKKKELFLYDDIKDNYQKGVLVHEMVHALQDQHFGLSNLHAATYDSDAELALAALIEGDAQYTTIEVLKQEQPFITKMLNTNLEKSKLVQNAFLYGVGAAYVQSLHKRGGWRAVNERFNFPPTSTAAILHPEQRITPINLGPGKRTGEFGLVRMFHANEGTRAMCRQAADGWRGDRSFEETGGKGWLVAFATAEQASLFRKTLAALRTAEYPALKSSTEGEAQVWKGEKGSRTILQRGNRVLEITAADARVKQALLDRAFGPPKVEVYSAKEKKTLSFGEFSDRLLDADIICVGELHDSEIHHAVQLMVIKALHARDERLGVGMEMFQRPYQKILDRYISGAIDESTMIEDTEYKTRWRFDWALYRPIVDYCRRNNIPLAGLNVSDELRARVRKVGVEKLEAEEKKQLGEVDFTVKAHRDYHFDRLGKMHGHGEMSDEQKESMYRIMTLWDDYMADSAAKFQKDRQLRRMVVLAGSGHIDHNFGIPDRAAKRTKGKAVSVNIQVGGDMEKMKKEPPADFILMVR